MPPRPSTANRLALLGGALASAAALTLSACGGGHATADTAGAPPKVGAEKPVATRTPCPARLSAFVDALDRLRRQLDVGLSYEQYAARVKALQRDYDAVPVDQLGLGCLANTGTPAEHAHNRYIDAANTWGECLADAACTTAAVEPVLQRKWRAASHFLGEAE